MVTHPPRKDFWVHGRKVHHWNHIKAHRGWVKMGHRWNSKGHRYWQCCETIQHSHSHQPSWAAYFAEDIQQLLGEENRRQALEARSQPALDSNQDESGPGGQA